MHKLLRDSGSSYVTLDFKKYLRNQKIKLYMTGWDIVKPRGNAGRK